MNREEWIKKARELYQNDGECEIDDDAVVSQAAGQEGAYVQAWVWVPADEDEGQS